jgi:hypothetical protein
VTERGAAVQKPDQRDHDGDHERAKKEREKTHLSLVCGWFSFVGHKLGYFALEDYSTDFN